MRRCRTSWTRTIRTRLTKAQVGLGNADNTSDKPVSTAVQTALNGKANASHTHVISDVTGLQTALDGKAATSHTHTIAQVTGLQAALDGKLSTAVTPSTPTRSIGTAFQPSTTKAVLCIYSVKTQVTNPLLVGTCPPTCTVRLLSDAASTPTTERGRVEASSGVGVTVTIALDNLEYRAAGLPRSGRPLCHAVTDHRWHWHRIAHLAGRNRPRMSCRITPGSGRLR
ncbi:hypothetical protein AB5I41_31460 [Sphingomonas sp. MMS24-JH45]